MYSNLCRLKPRFILILVWTLSRNLLKLHESHRTYNWHFNETHFFLVRIIFWRFLLLLDACQALQGVMKFSSLFWSLALQLSTFQHLKLMEVHLMVDFRRRTMLMTSNDANRFQLWRTCFHGFPKWRVQARPSPPSWKDRGNDDPKTKEHDSLFWYLIMSDFTELN